MENIKKKLNIRGFYALCPLCHSLALAGAGLILLHLLTRHNKGLMIWLSERAVQPLHRLLARFFSHVEFSAAEIIIYLAAAFVLLSLLGTVISLFRKKERLKTLYRGFMRIFSFVLMVYALFCMLWGVYYYGDDFMTKSGLKAEKISTEQLKTVTEYFADMANRYSLLCGRDERGVYTVSRQEILDKSPGVYENIEKQFPALQGQGLRAKPFRFSKILSYTDFTGFFFPFTAEANVNTDFPPSLFPSTVAHELAHQRGVAKEQEANFCAVLSSLSYGDPDYVYSAALLAYTHLGNALHGADYEAWEEIYRSLNDNVLRDFAANREYWKQFEGPARETMNTVYEGFLQSYDQKLGLKSYGACVDLLVNYYLEEAEQWKKS